MIILISNNPQCQIRLIINSFLASRLYEEEFCMSIKYRQQNVDLLLQFMLANQDETWINGSIPCFYSILKLCRLQVHTLFAHHGRPGCCRPRHNPALGGRFHYSLLNLYPRSVWLKHPWCYYQNLGHPQKVKSAGRVKTFYCETPIPKAKRIGIGKLNNPAKRRGQYPAACCEMFPKLALGFIPVIVKTLDQFCSLGFHGSRRERNAPPDQVEGRLHSREVALSCASRDEFNLQILRHCVCNIWVSSIPFALQISFHSFSANVIDSTCKLQGTLFLKIA
jgi:hypothetical protein